MGQTAISDNQSSSVTLNELEKTQRTSGPVNAHLMSWPGKVQNLEMFVANLQKMTLYNHNLDLGNANVCTNFG